MKTTQQKRVLPADIYDFLELSALAFGGIGAGMYGVDEEQESDNAPHCVWGHANYTPGLPLGSPALGDGHDRGEVGLALCRVGIDEKTNDCAVCDIRNVEFKMYSSQMARVPKVTFEQWCEELDVVRGVA